MRVLPARYFGRATGRHRQPTVRPVLLPDMPLITRIPVHGTVLGETELLSGWPEPERAPGAVLDQGFRDCPTCEQTTSGVVHKDGWTCGQCLNPVPAGGAQ